MDVSPHRSFLKVRAAQTGPEPFEPTCAYKREKADDRDFQYYGMHLRLRLREGAVEHRQKCRDFVGHIVDTCKRHSHFPVPFKDASGNTVKMATVRDGICEVKLRLFGLQGWTVNRLPAEYLADANEDPQEAFRCIYMILRCYGPAYESMQCVRTQSPHLCFGFLREHS